MGPKSRIAKKTPIKKVLNREPNLLGHVVAGTSKTTESIGGWFKLRCYFEKIIYDVRIIIIYFASDARENREYPQQHLS